MVTKQTEVGGVMGGCRIRYDDLPSHLRPQVDAALCKVGARARGTAGGKRRREANETEAAYRREVLGMRPDIAAVRYEGLSFRMANGHRYTPDWLVVTKAGGIECHEVKGRRALHSQQRARLAFDQARVEFPWAIWVWAVRSSGGWEIEP